MTDTDTDTLRALAQTLTTDYKLAGPWGWFGDTHYDPPYLATVHGGRQFVLGTQVRYELCDRDEDGEASNVREVDRDEAYNADDLDNLSLAAELTFPHRREGDPWSSMVRADKLPIFEVAPNALDATDQAVYRTEVNGLRNPVATYLSAVDPTTILALLHRIAELESRLAAATGTVSQTSSAATLEALPAGALIVTHETLPPGALPDDSVWVTTGDGKARLLSHHASESEDLDWFVRDGQSVTVLGASVRAAPKSA